MKPFSFILRLDPINISIQGEFALNDELYQKAGDKKKI